MSTHPDPAPPRAAATPYHRMARLRPEWSRPVAPVLTLLAALVAYVVLISVVLVLAILLLALAPGVNTALDVTSGDPTSPLDTALALAMGVMWLPAGIVGVRVGGWRPLGTAVSVAARWRRGAGEVEALWGAAAGLAVVAAAVLGGGVLGGGPTADGGTAGGATALAEAGPGRLALVALLLVVLVPVQTVGLELTLRGAVMQALGTWLRGPLLPLLAASAVMLIGRELTAAVVLPALALGAAAAVLAWKSGGLELPILLTATLTLAAQLVAALGAGTAAGAGAGALAAAAAAPGTSSAALPAGADPHAALAGGIAASLALLLVTAALVVRISRRAQVRLLQPVGRDAGAPVPARIPH